MVHVVSKLKSLHNFEIQGMFGALKKVGIWGRCLGYLTISTHMERCIEDNVAFVYLLGVSLNITNGAVMLCRCRFSCMPTRNFYVIRGGRCFGKGGRVSCGATFGNFISFIIFNDVVVSL